MQKHIAKLTPLAWRLAWRFGFALACALNRRCKMQKHNAKLTPLPRPLYLHFTSFTSLYLVYLESPHNEGCYASRICERCEPQQLIRGETGMSDGLFRVFKAIGLVLTLGMSMNAYAGFLGLGEDSWKEEVLLHDGSKLIVKRSQSYGGREPARPSPPASQNATLFPL